jgi:hypothetical protein
MSLFSKLESRLDHPPVLAVVVFVLAFFLMLIGWGLMAAGWLKEDKLYTWSIAAAFMLLYALANSLLSIRVENFMRYWGASMYSYLGLALASGLAAQMFSGVSISQAGSYRWIFFVVTFGFLVFLSLVNFVKRIVRFAEREEWNQPRKRGR